MITIVSAPALNRVFLDANNTEIELTSSNGAGYYFRALIYVDDVLFDTQGWSRKNAYTTVKDLVKLYNTYFEPVFAAFSANGLVEQTHLKKKISITIEERLLTNDSLAQTIDLPNFYFLYNLNPVSFLDTDQVKILGITPEVLQIPANGKIMIPFFVNASADGVVVILKDSFGSIINSQTIAPFTGKKVYLYSFDLSAVSLTPNTIFFKTDITVGITSTTLRHRLMRLPDFPVKEVYFKNNFGYYIPAYFDGELEVSNGFKINDYQEADGSSVIFEIQEDATYTINTGLLLADERAIINQVVNSPEVYFKVNGSWQKIQTASKKELEFRDKKHNYAQDLVFTFSKNGKIKNV